MTFRDLQNRLLTRVREMVRSGEISERRLARRCGYSQPHIHHVLKGARRLQSELADVLLRRLRFSVEELVHEAEAGPPVLEGLPAQLVSRYVDPYFHRLGPDDDSMSPLLLPGDLLLVDRAEAARRRPEFERVYLLALGGRMTVCRCQRVGAALVLVADNGRLSRALPERISLLRDELLEIVQGRVVLTLREMEGPVAML